MISYFRRLKPFRRTFGLLSYIFPRNSEVWVFGSWYGEVFGDNSKYLYLYASQQNDEVRAIWLSKDKDTIEELKSKGYEAYSVSSLKGIYYNLIAGKIIISNSIRDVNRWCSNGAELIQLWHGVPLKQIGADENKLDDTDWLEKNIIRPLRSVIYENFNYVSVTHERFMDNFASALDVDKEVIYPDGYPRNDIFNKDVNGSEIGCNFLDKLDNIEEDLVVYMPTWRDYDSDPLSSTEWSTKEMDSLMEDLGAHLLVKYHQHEEADVDKSYDNVTFLAEKTDVYPILQRANMLITDYSSVYFDFLHKNNPIVFFPYDIERYRDYRGFYLDYEAVTPGEKAYSFEELLQKIRKAKIKDNFVEARQEAREKFFKNSRQPSTERIYERLRDGY